FEVLQSFCLATTTLLLHYLTTSLYTPYMDTRDQQAGDIEKHFYFEGKRHLIEKLLEKAELPENAKILDVGCGTGSDLEVISKFGEVTVLDINQEALNQIPDKYNKICADLTETNLPDAEYDCIVAFDILEHIENQEHAARQLFHTLKPNGKFVGTVPAYQLLFSSHDKSLDHFRRYSRSNFVWTLENAGFHKLTSGYWMSLLFPFAAVSRLLNRKKEAKTSLKPLPEFLNNLVSKILKFEARIGTSKFFRFPYGLTTWLIATKRSNETT
ncbi:MAG: class I SAM-dependent methyltransferase, partial [Candidatus Peregrinibacteria bacterium]|nr:class I SAM-dependent methyltransferase [Candidatus Peregrinibacteria bacterium]